MFSPELLTRMIKAGTGEITPTDVAVVADRIEVGLAEMMIFPGFLADRGLFDVDGFDFVS